MNEHESTLTWLPECSPEAVRRGLRVAAPDLAGARIDLRTRGPLSPRSRRATALLNGKFVLKFAWSQPAAALAREARTLQALADLSLSVPRPLLVSWTPMLFLYRRIEGEPFVWDRLGAQPTAGRRAFAASVAHLLAELHAPATLEHVHAAGVALETPLPRVDGDRLRRHLLPRVDAERAAWVTRVLDRVDHVLTASAESLVFLHGDLHGWNMVVDAACTRVIGLLDLELACAGDHHFDLRYLPALAPTLDLTQRVSAEYERATGRRVLPERVLAWNVLTDLGDALWRTEAGVEVIGGPISRRIDGLAARLAAAELDWGGGGPAHDPPGVVTNFPSGPRWLTLGDGVRGRLRVRGQDGVHL